MYHFDFRFVALKCELFPTWFCDSFLFFFFLLNLGALFFRFLCLLILFILKRKRRAQTKAHANAPYYSTYSQTHTHIFSEGPMDQINPPGGTADAALSSNWNFFMGILKCGRYFLVFPGSSSLNDSTPRTGRRSPTPSPAAAIFPDRRFGTPSRVAAGCGIRPETAGDAVGRLRAASSVRVFTFSSSSEEGGGANSSPMKKSDSDSSFHTAAGSHLDLRVNQGQVATPQR